MRDINIWSLKAEYWGDKEDIKRIDFNNQKVELADNGWTDIKDVEFSLDDSYDYYAREREIQDRVDEKLRSEKSLLEAKMRVLKEKEAELEDKLKRIQLKESILKDLVVQERHKFEEYVTSTINNMNKIIDDVYRQSQVANRNEELKKPTPDYIKYESKVFDREIMRAIEEGK